MGIRHKLTNGGLLRLLLCRLSGVYYYPYIPLPRVSTLWTDTQRLAYGSLLSLAVKLAGGSCVTWACDSSGAAIAAAVKRSLIAVKLAELRWRAKVYANFNAKHSTVICNEIGNAPVLLPELQAQVEDQGLCQFQCKWQYSEFHWNWDTKAKFTSLIL